MRVAVLGSGQLARMLALEGIPLGIEFSFLAEEKGVTDTRCVDGLGHIAYWEENMTGEQLFEALKKPDVVTFEKEQIEIAPYKDLENYTQIAPSFSALAYCQNRNAEKTLLNKLNIPNASFFFADNWDDFKVGFDKLQLPVVVKSVTDGYDGKAQWRVKKPEDIDDVPKSAVAGGVIVEEFISFIKEVSVVGVRDRQGNKKFYPLAENTHDNGILVRSSVPAEAVDEALVQKAASYMERLLDEMEYVGVLAMECFVTEQDILVNELAPRVHNSGHWTQNGAVTSQFENHLRAITGLPLGSTEVHGFAGMINLLGPTEPAHISLTDRSTLHWYNKVVKPGRKQGHVNFVAKSRDDLNRAMDDLQAQIEAAKKG
ncbi:5-(carboxyamino)imidazole ribonucleotide synthase [Pleionea sp. CnH1-48]|uniref:5-(carboxyamino)imidazole ribonucleotide synthase n=1 Tax=Pleionea sp. CnH1-48 TaxID=2954494 RepID=UPI002096DC63|nr:5-(carboxyamino)imidazole ribonucleotide synthase [Pleionea sp. CnH1-48]MCO7222699.1 5-(carboxyamino)imidazole ribonucleotide synthase [Pleionea sp. CnH1-48]